MNFFALKMNLSDLFFVIVKLKILCLAWRIFKIKFARDFLKNRSAVLAFATRL